MSAISEINKVWLQKFPGSSLPEAWAEDVKTNLSKHKKRVLELEEELEQEKLYVEFLETLLAEVRQQNPPATSQLPDASNGVGNPQDIDDVIKDTLERRSIAAQLVIPQSPNSKSQTSTTHSAAVSEGGCRRNSGELELGDSPVENHAEVAPKESGPTDDEDSLEPLESNFVDDASEEKKDRDHFVTVIEVNGFHKKTSRSPSQDQSPPAEDLKRLRKVPPRPPPKCFKRQGSDTPHAEVPPKDTTPPSFSDPPPERDTLEIQQKPNDDRPVIFDSRKLSAGNGIISSSFSEGPGIASEISKQPIHLSSFAPVKRFEGSKQPLPDTQRREQDGQFGIERDQKSSSPAESRSSFLKPLPPGEKEVPARSKILDLVSRMESSQKPIPPNTSGEQLTPRRSFRKQFKGPVYHSVSPEAVLSDYVDPCDAEFDGTNNDQIYDSPPPEDFPSDLNSPSHKSKTNPLESRIAEAESHVEPMYGKFPAPFKRKHTLYV